MIDARIENQWQKGKSDNDKKNINENSKVQIELKENSFIILNNWQTCERTSILSDMYIRKVPWTIETEIEQ